MLGRAGAALQAARDLDQKLVAGGMPELVVDLLEAVEVEQETANSSPERVSRFRAASSFVEGDAIGQMGQRVLPHGTLGLDLPHHAPCERDRIDEHAAQQHRSVDHHQEGDNRNAGSPILPRQIAMPAKIGAVKAIAAIGIVAKAGAPPLASPNKDR